MPSSALEPRTWNPLTWSRATRSDTSGWPDRRTSPPRRRRPGLVVVGAVLAVGGGLAGFALVDAAQDRTAALAVSHDIEAGTAITAADLAEVAVAVPSGVAAVPASHRDALVGKVARTDLAAGSLLAPGTIGDPTSPGPGQSVVVLALPPSRLPASGLHPEERLVLVSTSETGSADSASSVDDAEQTGRDATTAVSTADAVVVKVGSADPTGTTPVDVAVQVADGPLWAGLAASGRVAVIVEPTGQVQR